MGYRTGQTAIGDNNIINGRRIAIGNSKYRHWQLWTHDKFVVGRKLWNQTEFTPVFTVVTNGNVGIGTNNPQNKLDVKGIIRAEEVKIEVASGADFVFKGDYNLMPIGELHSFVQENKHLPEIPPESEMIVS